MSAEVASEQATPKLHYLRWPKTIIARFVARSTLRSATFVALALGAFVASKTVGYAAAYPTFHERLVASALYVNNTGLIALFGVPHNIAQVPSFAAWYALAIGVLLGSIWAYLVSTKTLRGSEESGRWEMLLIGQTTSRRATANALAGLGASLVLVYVLTAVVFIAVGKEHSVDFAAGPALFLALAAIAGAIMFMAVGALTSQLMPTRARAAGLATAIFGVSYLLRAAGDITGAHWLLDITPLGWIERLQPIYAPRPIWLLPIAGFVVILCWTTVVLAGRRDMGESYFADRDTASPRFMLLGGPLLAAVRLTRAASLGWLLGLTALAVFFGVLTKTAAQAFSDSPTAANLLSHLAHNTTEVGAKAFLGIVFFMLMTVLMAYAASAISTVRNDEAQGYLDNFLVGPVARLRWLTGRVSLIVGVALLSSLVVGVASWLSLATQHTGVSFSSLLTAGLNMLAPTLFVLGVGVCALGLIPRLTSVIAYSVIAWSFLVQLLSSGMTLSHWVLDTSVFTHVAFAPTVDPRWGTNLILITIGLVLALLGVMVFNRRDLIAE